MVISFYPRRNLRIFYDVNFPEDLRKYCNKKFQSMTGGYGKESGMVSKTTKSVSALNRDVALIIFLA
ncbi:hypothetical protein ACM39_18100 [Chryseobacterium sp. FH2]|nr:hypothetical protein ACM39_18100 [Chryseobacterium sp. FH2]